MLINVLIIFIFRTVSKKLKRPKKSNLVLYNGTYYMFTSNPFVMCLVNVSLRYKKINC